VFPIAAPRSGPTPPHPGADPLDGLARWPAAAPVGAFISGSDPDRAVPAWERSTVIAHTGPVIARTESELARSVRPLDELASVATDPGPHGAACAMSYELGRIIEPRARHARRDARPARSDRAWTAFGAHRALGALVCDASTGLWSVSGDVPLPCDQREARWEVSAFASHTGARAFQNAVARAVEYTHAGDCFQVNLAHRLGARFTGSVRGLAVNLLRTIRPSLGSYIETMRADGSFASAIISVSPELFLHYDARSRIVTTRPIKGTRAAREGAADLERSAKDGAELAMIVDLMRNDLGRVCGPGTIRVDRPRDTESFGRDPRSAVRHTVATVSGALAHGRSAADLIGACFPPGSVTGAPKIRAMQIIEELEPVARGPYCGAIAWFHPSGDATMSVPIRTIAFTADPGSTPAHATGTLDLHVGAGIVAESDPRSEWIETLHKAATILAPLGQDAMSLDR